MSKQTKSRISIERMATDSAARLRRIDHLVALYEAGLISEAELNAGL